MTDFVSGIDAIYNYHLPTTLQVTIKMPTDGDGNAVFYTQLYPPGADKDVVFATDIASGNYLQWPAQTIAAPDQPVPPAPSPTPD